MGGNGQISDIGKGGTMKKRFIKLGAIGYAFILLLLPVKNVYADGCGSWEFKEITKTYCATPLCYNHTDLSVHVEKKYVRTCVNNSNQVREEEDYRTEVGGCC